MGDDKNTPLISKYIDRYALLCRLIWIKSSLVTNDNLRKLINRCAEVLVEHCEVAFARIWTLNETENHIIFFASQNKDR